MIRLTDEQCARCTDRLASSNRNADRLCGKCQRELGSGTAAYREWKQRGGQREVTRPEQTAGGMLARLASMKFADLQALAAASQAELERRTEEAEAMALAGKKTLRALTRASTSATKKAGA